MLKMRTNLTYQTPEKRLRNAINDLTILKSPIRVIMVGAKRSLNPKREF